MVSTIKNIDGLVIAYIEWEIVDKTGQFQNNGKYIYIQNLWVHKKYRREGLSGKLAQKIFDHPYSQKSEEVYWCIARDNKGEKIIDEEERNTDSLKVSKPIDKLYILNKLIRRE